MVVPGTPRDSLQILDSLLDLDVGVKPEMVATGNASCTGMVFGLFTTLGYNFSSRFKDLNDQRFWRAQGRVWRPVAMDRWRAGPQRGEPEQGHHSPAGHAADARLAGDRADSRAQPAAGVRPCEAAAPLGQAFTEYGRIAKTLNLRPDHAGIGRYGSHAQILSRSLSVRH